MNMQHIATTIAVCLALCPVALGCSGASTGGGPQGQETRSLPGHPPATESSSAPNHVECLGCSPSIFASVSNADPTTVAVFGAGFTPNGPIFAGSWNGSNWIPNYLFSFADANGDVFGQFTVDCLQARVDTVYGYDYTTGAFTNGFTANLGCIQ